MHMTVVGVRESRGQLDHASDDVLCDDLTRVRAAQDSRKQIDNVAFFDFCNELFFLVLTASKK